MVQRSQDLGFQNHENDSRFPCIINCSFSYDHFCNITAGIVPMCQKNGGDKIFFHPINTIRLDTNDLSVVPYCYKNMSTIALGKSIYTFVMFVVDFLFYDLIFPLLDKG